VTMIPPAVDRSVTVSLTPAEAFELFTREMRLWWPFAGHSCGGESGGDVVFEPRTGGAVTEYSRTGETWRWGTLAEWDPPCGFVMSWHPGMPAELATRLRVAFSAGPGGTVVRVLHDGWEARGAQAPQKRDQYDAGWPQTLQAYAAAVAAKARA
jgi:Activator of Hsp90 ATPase homolog 1-like protein